MRSAVEVYTVAVMVSPNFYSAYLLVLPASTEVEAQISQQEAELNRCVTTQAHERRRHKDLVTYCCSGSCTMRLRRFISKARRC